MQKWDKPNTGRCKKCRILWVYPKIAVSLKFLLFYPNPKGDKRNFKLVSVQIWDTPNFVYIFIFPSSIVIILSLSFASSVLWVTITNV
jgi:hypothetical protein